jgi:hypothetical protein
MFVDRQDIDEPEYLCLLVLLDVARQAGYAGSFDTVLRALTTWMSRHRALTALEKLRGRGLIYFSDKDGEDVRDAEWLPVVEADGGIGLSWFGLAFLINYANEYLDRINEAYQEELPEQLIANLIPYLELESVPAADRFVSTKDNLADFKTLENELAIIRLELIKDENKNELPISDKRAVLSDLDAILAQIGDGMVRLLDLTSRIRPLVRNLAEVCKDFAVNAGAASAASAAYFAISNILQKIFS